MPADSPSPMTSAQALALLEKRTLSLRFGDYGDPFPLPGHWLSDTQLPELRAFIEAQEAKLTAAEADTQRMDWIEGTALYIAGGRPLYNEIGASRGEIDEARTAPPQETPA